MNNTDFDLIAFGHRVQTLRMRQGLSQSGLAKKLNISESYMCNIENGRRGTDAILFIRMSLEFHVTIDFLVLGYEQFPVYHNEKIKDILDAMQIQIKELRSLTECPK